MQFHVPPHPLVRRTSGHDKAVSVFLSSSMSQLPTCNQCSMETQCHCLLLRRIAVGMAFSFVIYAYNRRRWLIDPAETWTTSSYPTDDRRDLDTIPTMMVLTTTTTTHTCCQQHDDYHEREPIEIPTYDICLPITSIRTIGGRDTRIHTTYVFVRSLSTVS